MYDNPGAHPPSLPSPHPPLPSPNSLLSTDDDSDEAQARKGSGGGSSQKRAKLTEDELKMDPRSLARLRNRDQAKKSRDKKKRANESTAAELGEARRKISEQAELLAKCREGMKAHSQLLETNRLLAEENLRLQSLLFPDPNDPLKMAVISGGGGGGVVLGERGGQGR